ncbi:MAG: transposase [Bacteroidales bacterium]|nr:transposase [Bacteroidales bacterium]
MDGRKPNRLHKFDYTKDRLYFITSCVKNRVQYFGEIRNGEMIYNPFGQIVIDQWEWLLNQYSYLVSHAFVVMPDHIHAVLEINRRGISGIGQDIWTGRNAESGRDDVGTGRDLSLHGMETDMGPKGLKIKPLSQIIGAFKTTVSKRIHLAGGVDFLWQRSFFDRIIRNEKEYRRIIEYIHSNPANWNEDEWDI